MDSGFQSLVGFWIPVTGFQYLSVGLGFWVSIVSGIPFRGAKMIDAKFRFRQCSHDYIAPLNSFLSIILYTDQIFYDDYLDLKRNILNLFKVAEPKLGFFVKFHY